MAAKIKETKEFCLNKGITIHSILKADALQNISLIDEAFDALLESEATKTNYLSISNAVNTIYKAILPDPKATEYYQVVRLIKVIADKLRSFDPPVDISEIMKKIGKVLDESVKAEQYLIKESDPIDLSTINFDALRKWFEKNKKNSQAEKLKNALKVKVSAMIMLNKERIDFAERLQQLIDEYNSGAINVEQFFDNLIKFAKDLNEEEQHGIAEKFTEEELAVLDLLKQPKLSEKKR